MTYATLSSVSACGIRPETVGPLWYHVPMSENENTQSLPSVRQGDHGKWAVYVDGKRVSRFFDRRIDAQAFGVPNEFRTR